MSFLNRLFSKNKADKKHEDVLKIATIIGSTIDKIVVEVFAAYRKELLAEPITYIVPAVWGAKKDGELTETQKEMNGNIAPVVNDVLKAFEFNGLSAAQEFAIGFIIRGLIISKITYMIEGVKNRTTDMLDQQEPMGSA